MPVLNEAEGMKVILPKVDKSWVDQILVVDGQSTDDTVSYAREMGCDVYIQKTPGIRHAYREAWPLIKGDIVITFSPDGNCLPEVIPQLLAKIREGYGMVIASRYLNGARSEDDDALTRFGNWMFTNLINLLHGGHYTDAMGIYRAYSKSLFNELGLGEEAPFRIEKFFHTVSGIEPLLSIRAARKKIKTAEVLGIEKSRVAGERKLQAFRWGAVYLYQTLRERLH